LAFGPSIRGGSRCVGNVDIALLAANRRLTMEDARQGGQNLTPSRRDAKDSE
jgi:hypothetical protein